MEGLNRRARDRLRVRGGEGTLYLGRRFFDLLAGTPFQEAVGRTFDIV